MNVLVWLYQDDLPLILGIIVESDRYVLSYLQRYGFYLNL